MLALLDFIQTLLLTEYLGCEMTGAKTEYFPNGGPVPKAGDINSKCDLKGQDYKIIFNVMRVLFWLSLPAVTKISGGLQKPKDWFKRLVYALVGATLMVKTFMDLLNIIIAVADPNAIEDINFYFPTIKPWIVYGIAAVGFIRQQKKKNSTVGPAERASKQLNESAKHAEDAKGKAEDFKDNAGKIEKIFLSIDKKLEEMAGAVVGAKEGPKGGDTPQTPVVGATPQTPVDP